MSKGYILSAHRSEANPVKKQLIIYYLKMLGKAGGNLLLWQKLMENSLSMRMVSNKVHCLLYLIPMMKQ
jgi:hypothetical protein